MPIKPPPDYHIIMFAMASAVVIGVLLNMALEPIMRYAMAVHP